MASFESARRLGNTSFPVAVSAAGMVVMSMVVLTFPSGVLIHDRSPTALSKFFRLLNSSYSVMLNIRFCVLGSRTPSGYLIILRLILSRGEGVALGIATNLEELFRVKS